MNEDINEDINELLEEKASQLKEHGFDLTPMGFLPHPVNRFGLHPASNSSLAGDIKKDKDEVSKFLARKGVIRIKASDLQRPSWLLRRMIYKKSLLKKMLNLARDCGRDLHIEF